MDPSSSPQAAAAQVEERLDQSFRRFFLKSQTPSRRRQWALGKSSNGNTIMAADSSRWSIQGLDALQRDLALADQEFWSTLEAEDDDDDDDETEEEENIHKPTETTSVDNDDDNDDD
mmetsp:Transcript_21241/g.58817  ORF Transcript_21241/g.58817 Transcript_21241/m.58817 type:complete len:117 (-) Transcript_21241:389-739(-)